MLWDPSDPLYKNGGGGSFRVCEDLGRKFGNLFLDCASSFLFFVVVVFLKWRLARAH